VDACRTLRSKDRNAKGTAVNQIISWMKNNKRYISFNGREERRHPAGVRIKGNKLKFLENRQVGIEH